MLSKPADTEQPTAPLVENPRQRVDASEAQNQGGDNKLNILHAGIKFIVLLGALATMWQGNAVAETRALLIGVSNYPSLPEKRSLKGPANDVQLLRDTFIDKGIRPANILVLADGVQGSIDLPTKTNVLLQLHEMAQRSMPGDWNIVYFSGHGSQQPQPPPNKIPPDAYIEPDGLDEIFLPYDVGSWDGGIHSVKNALIDDEIGHALTKFLSTGSLVWAIFDTCHAGDMAKNISLNQNEQVTRFVEPSDLGIPDGAFNTSPSQGKSLTKAREKRSIHSATEYKNNKLVVFYASQPNEPAAEESLPAVRGIQNAPSRYFGLFTFLIADEFKRWHGSFQQLANVVAARYKSRPYPTPFFEGDLDQIPYFSTPALTIKSDMRPDL